MSRGSILPSTMATGDHLSNTLFTHTITIFHITHKWIYDGGRVILIRCCPLVRSGLYTGTHTSLTGTTSRCGDSQTAYRLQWGQSCGGQYFYNSHTLKPGSSTKKKTTTKETPVSRYAYIIIINCI